MKRFVSILLAVLTLASLLTVNTAARGYVLSIPESVSAHNLEAYGSHTMNVYSTEVAPQIDGKVDEGEYPGPDGEVSLQCVPGDNLWMNAYYPNKKDQKSYYPECDWTEYVDKRDMPDYIKTRLTYDDEYLYFAVSTVIPAIRTTKGDDAVSGALKNAFWFVDTRLNFMQSNNIALSHGGNSSSFAQNRYNLYKYVSYDTAGDPVAQSAQSVEIIKRIYTLYEDEKFNTVNVGTYVDDLGQTWNSNVYKREENFQYKVTLEEDGKWGVVFEGRQPLADILRITDVEYEDGTPIDYVPEWGAWGFDIRLQAYYGKTTVLPDGTELTIRPEDVIYAQTFLPAGGAGNSGKYAKLNGYNLHNTVSAAVKLVHGKETVGPTFLMNPVHFLGSYDKSFDFDGYYQTPEETAISSTSRVTRTRGVLTSGVRGVNNRVIGVATKAAASTGDSLTLTVVCSAVMILCAAGAVVAVAMKKRSSHK